MAFEIRGLDEAHRQLQDMINNLDNEKIAEWFEKVAKIANEICPDAKVVFERNVVEGQIGQIKLPDRKNIDCVIKAVDRVVKEAPEPTRSMLLEYKNRLEVEKAKPQSNNE